MSLAPYIPGYDDNTPFVLLAATGHLGLEAPFVPAPQTAAGENSSCVYPFCKHAGLAQETTAELHYEHWHIFHVPSLPRNQLKGTEWFDVFPSGKVKGGASPRYPLASGKRHIARQAYLLLLQRRILKVLGIDFDPELLPRTCVVTRNLLVRPEVLLTVLKNAEERKQKEEEEGRLKEAKTSSAKQRELGRDDPSSYEPSSDDDVAHHLMAHQKPAAGLDQQISEPKSEQAAFRSALEASKAKLSKLQDKLQDKEKTCRRLEKLLVQRDQQLKEGRAAKTEAAKKISNITAERNNFKKALDRAHSDVVRLESELLALQEGLEQNQAEIAELQTLKDATGIEVDSLRTALKPLQTEKLSQDQELKNVKDSYEAAQRTIAELQQQLDSTQEDLTDALACGARQEESSRSPVSAPREPDTPYREATAQQQAWNFDTGSESEGVSDGDESISDEEVDEHNELNTLGDGDDSSTIHNTTAEHYDMVEPQADLVASPSPTTLVGKLRRKMTKKSSFRRRVDLYAIKELEDDIEEAQRRLAVLFNSAEVFSDLTGLKREIERELKDVVSKASKLHNLRSRLAVGVGK